MNIIDCFTFFNELDLLELRLEILNKYVSKFVIVEADTTHSGIAKPYYLDQNYARFKPWSHKIEYIKVDGLPTAKDRWLAENTQRNALSAGITGQEDMVIISDCDEIPDFRQWNGNEGVFLQLHTYYAINQIVRRPWRGSVIVRGWRFASPYGKIRPQDCRNFRDMLNPVGGGWHFSWLGSYKEKVKSFAHSELEGSTKDPLRSPGEGLELETINLKEYEQFYPEPIISDRLKYNKWIAQKEATNEEV